MLRFALAQLLPGPGDVAGNVGTVLSTIHAHKGNADLLAFPELFLTGYDIGTERMHELALPSDSPYLSTIGAAAADAGIAVILSYPERVEADVYIAVIVFDSDGRVAHRHRKTHLWGPFEHKTFTPGAGDTITSFPLMCSPHRFGVGICFELEFPEFSRLLALSGATFLFFPAAASPKPDMTSIHLFGQVRAMENSVFCAYINHPAAPDLAPDRITFSGGSFLATPYGTLGKCASPSEAPQIITAVVDPDADALKASRERNPYLRARRPELYTALTAPATPQSPKK